MYPLDSCLSADPSRDPHKFSKWRRRAMRIESALDNDALNGDTEQMERILRATDERLLQLAGVIPSVHHGMSHKRNEKNADTDLSLMNDKGEYVFYSSGGYDSDPMNGEQLLTADREQEIDAEIHAIAEEIWKKMRTSIVALMREDDLIRRFEDLWENNDENVLPAPAEPSSAQPVKPIGRPVPDYRGNFSAHKDAALYALDQLGFE